MGILPVKFRVLQIIFQQQETSVENIYCMLKREYPRDACINERGIGECLLSLKTAGLIEVSDAAIAADGKLLPVYRITSQGIGKMKYIG